jgi:hypothetical protein
VQAPLGPSSGSSRSFRFVETFEHIARDISTLTRPNHVTAITVGSRLSCIEPKKGEHAGIDDDLDKGIKVSRIVKDCLSTIAVVEDVIPHAADGSSGSSWHATILKQAGLSVNICYVSFPWLQFPSTGMT